MFPPPARAGFPVRDRAAERSKQAVPESFTVPVPAPQSPR
jgi:hypothetical protein